MNWINSSNGSIDRSIDRLAQNLFLSWKSFSMIYYWHLNNKLNYHYKYWFEGVKVVFKWSKKHMLFYRFVESLIFKTIFSLIHISNDWSICVASNPWDETNMNSFMRSEKIKDEYDNDKSIKDNILKFRNGTKQKIIRCRDKFDRITEKFTV